MEARVVGLQPREREAGACVAALKKSSRSADRSTGQDRVLGSPFLGSANVSR